MCSTRATTVRKDHQWRTDGHSASSSRWTQDVGPTAANRAEGQHWAGGVEAAAAAPPGREVCWARCPPGSPASSRSQRESSLKMRKGRFSQSWSLGWTAFSKALRVEGCAWTEVLPLAREPCPKGRPRSSTEGETGTRTTAREG